MILPSKHVSANQALIGVGAVLLAEIGLRRRTVTSLWEAVRTNRAVGTFERFVLALDLLYLTGAVELVDGLVAKVRA